MSSQLFSSIKGGMLIDGSNARKVMQVHMAHKPRLSLHNTTGAILAQSQHYKIILLCAKHKAKSVFVPLTHYKTKQL